MPNFKMWWISWFLIHVEQLVKPINVKFDIQEQELTVDWVFCAKFHLHWYGVWLWDVETAYIMNVLAIIAQAYLFFTS